MQGQTIKCAIKLGSKVTDKVSGFSGIVTGVARYLTGCNQYAVVPKAKSDADSAPDAAWYDEGRLEVITDNSGITAAEVAADDNGGAVSAAPNVH